MTAIVFRNHRSGHIPGGKRGALTRAANFDGRLLDLLTSIPQAKEKWLRVRQHDHARDVLSEPIHFLQCVDVRCSSRLVIVVNDHDAPGSL